MNKATHTPGPWERFPVPGHGLEVWTEGDGPRDSGLPSAKPICEVLTTAADANLIAAAPDLLAACEAVFATMQQRDALDRASGLEDVRASLMAAIAKAKGGAA